MKHQFKFLAMAVCFMAFCTVSCSKEEESTPQNDNGGGSTPTNNAPSSLVGTKWLWEDIGSRYGYGSQVDNWEKYELNFISASEVRESYEKYYCDHTIQSIDPNYTPTHDEYQRTYNYSYSNGSGYIDGSSFSIDGNKLVWKYRSYKKKN